MSGTTPGGIRYPDAASRAQDLGTELKRMAEDIEQLLFDSTAVFYKGTLSNTIDLLTVTEPGLYGYWGSAPNAPGGASGIMLVSPMSTNVVQVMFEYSGPRMWKRFRTAAGSWSTLQQIDGTVGQFSRGFVGTGGNLNSMTTPGTHGYWSSSVNRPSDVSGTVITMPVNTENVLVQVAFEYDTNVIWKRFRSASGAWSEWLQVTGQAHPSPTSDAASPSMLKTIPLALTVGSSPSAVAPYAQGSVRMPVRFGARVQRWRLHLRDVNPRVGTPGTQQITVPAVHFGLADGDGPAYAAQQIATNLTGTGDVVTPWQNTPLEPDTRYILGYRWSAPSVTNSVAGGGWLSATPGDAAGTGTGLSRVNALPLDAWIEAEVDPLVPVIAGFGDSISSGIGADFAVYESWLSIYCRSIGALPVHYTASGDGMIGWENPQHYKWARWQHLTRPDAVIHAMGSNDIFAPTVPTLAELQRRHSVVTNLLATYVSPNVYGTRITPRTSQTGESENRRRAYNAWLTTLPNGLRDLFDFVTPISNDDETVIPAYTTDGTHLTTAGYERLAAAVTPRVVPVPVGDRLAALEQDTGWRLLPTDDVTGTIRDPAKPGTLRIRRVNDRVTIRVLDVGLVEGSTQGVLFANGTFTTGFRTGSAVGGQLRDPIAHAGYHSVMTWGTHVRWQSWWSGSIQSQTRPTGGSASGELSWTTDDPWPATLPGTPA